MALRFITTKQEARLVCLADPCVSLLPDEDGNPQEGGGPFDWVPEADAAIDGDATVVTARLLSHPEHASCLAGETVKGYLMATTIGVKSFSDQGDATQALSDMGIYVRIALGRYIMTESAEPPDPTAPGASA